MCQFVSKLAASSGSCQQDLSDFTAEGQFCSHPAYFPYCFDSVSSLELIDLAKSLFGNCWVNAIPFLPGIIPQGLQGVLVLYQCIDISTSMLHLSR